MMSFVPSLYFSRGQLESADELEADVVAGAAFSNGDAMSVPVTIPIQSKEALGDFIRACRTIQHNIPLEWLAIGL